MKRFITFGKILRIEDQIESVKDRYLSNNEPMPTIEMTGTEKIHGTNSSFSYNEVDGYWFQGRKRIITILKDNALCALWMEKRKAVFIDIIKTLAKEHDVNLNTHTISFYGEYAGSNLTPFCAVLGLDILFMAFKYAKVSPIDAPDEDDEHSESNYWITTNAHDAVSERIFNITNFPMVKMLVDFNDSTDDIVDQFSGLILETEASSKVGEQFGVQGNVGEGYVFDYIDNGRISRFKVKGKGHKKANPNKIKVQRVRKEMSDKDHEKLVLFVHEFGATDGRLEQFILELKNEHGKLEMKHLGKYIQLVLNDVKDEEESRIEGVGVSWTAISKAIASNSSTYFISELKSK